MRSRILTVFRKEMIDSLRDRRTALMVLFASILTGPLTMVLLAQYVTSMEEKASTLRVRMVGGDHAPALVNFFQRADVEIEQAPADYAARVKEGKLDAVIVVRPDFSDRFQAGEPATVELVFDDSRTESQPAIRQAERLLRAFGREAGMLRLLSRGVSTEIADPLRIERVNTATPRQKGAFLMFLIPLFAILSPLLGGMTIAIDATAGERERGSLEPLLGNPVPAGRIVIGKWLAAWVTGAGVAALTLLGFVLAAALYKGKPIATILQFGFAEFGLFLAFVIPFAAATAALQMLISTYGRSYREAQTYVSYFASLASFVPMVVIFSGLKEAFWQFLVPVLGQQMALTRILRGEGIALEHWLGPTFAAAVVAAVCLSAVARLLTQERIVFGRA